MRRAPGHGVVSLPALDLRASPSHASEMKSQLLLGEVVRVLKRSPDRQWLRVKNVSDGYAGWVRGWGVVESSRSRAHSWLKLARSRVVATSVELRTQPGGGGVVSPLYWGATVIRGLARGRFVRVELPDGRRGWGPRGGFESVADPGPPLGDRIQSLMGVPYLWGGRTPFGLDCSGFTQLVLGEQGVVLPRDCVEQFEAARSLPEGEQPQTGDLVFFGHPGKPPAHVGISLGGAYFAHVRGRVRLASLDKDNPLYDNEIGRQFRSFGRPGTGPGRGRPRGLQGRKSA